MLWAGRASAAVTACPGPRPGSSLSLLAILQPKMPHHDVDSGAAAEMLSQLLGQVYRTVLSAGAAEGDHQISEATACPGPRPGLSLSLLAILQPKMPHHDVDSGAAAEMKAMIL